MGLIAAGAGAALMIGGAAMSAGKKVKVPTFQRVNTEKEQEAAIKQNIASLQSGTELATKTTAAEQTLLEQQLRRAIPGYDQLISQASENIGANLRGEMSPEAKRNVQRFAAQQSLGSGYGSASGMGTFGAIEKYARGSEARQQAGLAQAQSFIQQQRTMGMAQPFSVSSMFISPNQRIGFMQQQQQAQYARDMAAAQVAAQPSAMKQAFGSAITQFTGTTGGSMYQRGLTQMAGNQSPYSSYNPQNDPELYSTPSTNIGGPTDPSNWA